jgi:hypothetical protein
MKMTQSSDPPTIAVDVDEVLGRYVRSFCLFYNKQRKTNFTEDQFISYKFSDTLGINPLHAGQLCLEFHDSEEFLNIEPVAGAFEGLCELKKLGYNLEVVTSRSEVMRDVTKTWIEQHYPGIFPSAKLHFTNSFGETGARYTKYQVCSSEKYVHPLEPSGKALNAVVLIDDNPTYTTDVASRGMFGILFGEYGWNRNAYDGLEEANKKFVVRCKDWREVVKFITTQWPIDS